MSLIPKYQRKKDIRKAYDAEACVGGCVIVMLVGVGGYWGKGDSVDAAVKAAQFLEVGHEVRVIWADNDAYVDELGRLRSNARTVLGVGILKRERVQGENSKFELRYVVEQHVVWR